MKLAGRVIIEQLEVHAYHGWHAYEGEFGQAFSVDIELEVDIEKAATTDHLQHAVDYGKVVAETRRLFVERRYKLVEAAAAGLADDLLREFPAADAVFVRVRKLRPPIPERLTAVGVELRIGRNASHARKS